MLAKKNFTKHLEGEVQQVTYTDVQLKNATQVAYQDFNKPYYELVQSGKKPPFTIEELCAQMVTNKYPTADDVYKKMFPNLNGENIKGWKIVDYYNNNAATGFYGCLIDTGNGDAIIGFRGSEGMDDLDNLRHDWLEADLGLLNNTLTKQQGDVEKFLDQISKSEYINNYNSIAMTGHSLGGNLAEHAAIMSSEYGLDDKLAQCMSFDGPGFSNEYINKNRVRIEKVSEKITHYKWSPVGGLLSELPGVERISLKYKESDNFFYNLIGRHSTESIIFDENGAAERGEPSMWDILTSKFSQGIDHMPTIVGDVLVGIVSTLWYGATWMSKQMFDKNGVTPFGQGVITAATVFAIGFGPLKTMRLVTTIVFAVVVAFFAVIAFEFAYELIEFIINEIVDEVMKIFNWVADKSNDLRDFISKGLKVIKEELKNIFDNGYKYANNYPEIKVDTYKLTTYAGRLQAVNRRLSNLDSRIDKLYWKVGLLDLLKLMKSDYKIGYSSRINSCANYLNNTASDFNNAEQSIANNL